MEIEEEKSERLEAMELKYDLTNGLFAIVIMGIILAAMLSKIMFGLVFAVMMAVIWLLTQQLVKAKKEVIKEHDKFKRACAKIDRGG